MNVDKEFQILPSTGSMIMEMMIVIILFLGYIIYISYLSAYKTGFKPNYIMFLDMLFDKNDNQHFQTYIKNIVDDKNTKIEKETFQIKKTDMDTETDTKTETKTDTKTKTKTFFNYLHFHFFKFISKFYLAGNQIHISKKDLR